MSEEEDAAAVPDQPPLRAAYAAGSTGGFQPSREVSPVVFSGLLVVVSNKATSSGGN